MYSNDEFISNIFIYWTFDIFVSLFGILNHLVKILCHIFVFLIKTIWYISSDYGVCQTLVKIM
jgi:hypothetical protein